MEANIAGVEADKEKSKNLKLQMEIDRLNRKIAHLEGRTYEKIREDNPDEPLT